jgi:hypothetical protein
VPGECPAGNEFPGRTILIGGSLPETSIQVNHMREVLYLASRQPDTLRRSCSGRPGRSPASRVGVFLGSDRLVGKDPVLSSFPVRRK